MNIDKLTAQFQQDLGVAQSIAIAKNNSAIEAVHVLSAMLQNTDSSVGNLLLSTNIDIQKLKQEINKEINTLATQTVMLIFLKIYYAY